MNKQVTVRTCIGCMEKKPQRELVRLGKGRGCYLCPKEECFEKAMKRKAFARAFRRSVSKEEIDGFKKEFTNKIPSRDRDGPC